MTYLTKARRRPVVAQRRGLGSFVDDVLEQARGRSDQQACVDAANAAVAPFEQKNAENAAAWTPTGFYTSDDIRNVVSNTMSVLRAGQAAIDAAAKEANASQDTVMRVTSDISRAGSRALDYLDAARQADQQGVRVINAAGLKRWVTDSMATAADALVAAAVIGCIRPWWVGALAAFQNAFDTAWSVMRQIVGAVIAIGEAVLKVPDALDDFMTAAMIATGVGLGIWLVMKAKAKFDKPDDYTDRDHYFDE